MSTSSAAPESRVKVELGSRSYEVRVVTGQVEGFGPFVRDALDQTWSGKSCRTALVITDSHLAELNTFARFWEGEPPGEPRHYPARTEPRPPEIRQDWEGKPPGEPRHYPARTEPRPPGNTDGRLAFATPYQAALGAAGIEADVAVVPAGEASKSLGQASRLYDELVRRQADRHTLIVALGGGVIGDLGGFLAATYARGLPLIMVPTTLLAQVDSSVGGKVGINHPDAKNIIGAFYQPAAVWIDTETLRTLPDRELRCGLAEVVKYGVILDAGFFDSLERDVERIMNRDNSALRRIVIESCRMKATVVTRDEREETGLRAVLNFGHTIGHAIEAVAGYEGPFQHGEAVAVGMIAEARLAQRLGWIGADAVDRLVRLLKRFGLPTSAPGLDPDRLVAAMARDKKNRQGKIRFVLPRSIGQVELTDAAGHDDVRAVLTNL